MKWEGFEARRACNFVDAKEVGNEYVNVINSATSWQNFTFETIEAQRFTKSRNFRIDRQVE